MKRPSKRPLKRLLPWLLGLLIAIVLVLALRPRPLAVDPVEVSRGALQVLLEEEGETRVRDRFVISSPLAGRVLRIDLEPGDPVTAGETVLATFQPANPNFLDARGRAEAEGRVRAAGAAVGRAKADRHRAEAEESFWEAEQQRISRLAEQGIVSRGDAEAAELNLRTRKEGLRAAIFAVRASEYDLEVARAALLGTGRANEPGDSGGAVRRDPSGVLELRSPVDGAVLRRLRESETVVPAGEPLLEVGNPLDLEIIADYLSRDAVKIRAGQSVVIDQWGGEAPLSGVVRNVEPAGFLKVSALGVEEQRVNVIIDLVEPPTKRENLGDGYRVETRVVIWEKDDVLKIPTSSLFRDGEDWAVFVAENEISSLRRVEIGRRGELEAEVTGGLEEGESVLVHPSDSVEDGSRIRARESHSQ